MNHLIVCPEYPPAVYAGGIGAYVYRISRLLAGKGETVHVIATRWKGAPLREERVLDRLIIHRVGETRSLWQGVARSGSQPKELQGLQASSFPPQSFSYQAGLLAEHLIDEAGIDVIEGQEFEAPLYYLLLRRALGLGPRRQPPCIVHLHSPMELIVRNNDWDIAHPYFQTARSLEEYCIRAADAWLCPSRYLARQAQARYGLPDGGVQVIPLPIDARPQIDREPSVWENGAILYVGRLERRKGILEWLDAAVRAACRDPRLTFEFVGANCLSTDHLKGEEIIARLVPHDLKNRFHFHGQQKQEDLHRFYASARLAVVPSRWENFPNACLEAMGSGLPVIATREGGMVEMIDDGHTGWLAKSADADGLYEALQRALRTPAEDLARMGAAASASIRNKCDNTDVVEKHVKFRSDVFKKGASRSLRLPQKAHAVEEVSHSAITLPHARGEVLSKGIAVIITSFNSGRYLGECLEALRRQTCPPVAAVIVDDNSTDAETGGLLQSAEKEGWRVLHRSRGDRMPARNYGIRHILDSGLHPAGFSFVRAEDRLAPGFIETCAGILDHCPEVGLVSGWIEFMGKERDILIHPCPGFPRQWIVNEIAPFAAIRTEALVEAGQFRTGMDDEFESWDLFNAVLAANWAAVSVPVILGACRFKGKAASGSHLNTQKAMHRAMLDRYPEMVAADAVDVILIAESRTGLLLQHQYFVLRSPLWRAFDRISGSRFLARLRSVIRNG